MLSDETSGSAIPFSSAHFAMFTTASFTTLCRWSSTGYSKERSRNWSVSFRTKLSFTRGRFSDAQLPGALRSDVSCLSMMRFRHASIMRLICPDRLLLVELPVVEQSAPTSAVCLGPSSVFVSTCKRRRIGTPRKMSLHASLSTATSYVAFASDSYSDDRCKTVRGAVQVLQKRNDAAFSPIRSASWRPTGSIAVSFPITLKNAASATVLNTSVSSVPSSYRPLHLNEVRPSDNVMEKSGEILLHFVSFCSFLTRPVVPSVRWLA